MRAKPCSVIATFKMSEALTQLACMESNRKYGTS